MIRISERDEWKLFLDDERTPKDDTWTIARTAQEAKDLIAQKGCPVAIAFDHDLGYTIPQEMIGKDPRDYPMVKTPIGYFREGIIIEETGLDFAKWFANQVLDGAITLPEDFAFSVHSSNPEGHKNIQSYMDSFMKHMRESRGE